MTSARTAVAPIAMPAIAPAEMTGLPLLTAAGVDEVGEAVCEAMEAGADAGNAVGDMLELVEKRVKSALRYAIVIGCAHIVIMPLTAVVVRLSPSALAATVVAGASELYVLMQPSNVVDSMPFSIRLYV